MHRNLLSMLLFAAACGDLAETDSPDLVDAGDPVTVEFNPGGGGGSGVPPPPLRCLAPRGTVDHKGAINAAETWAGGSIHTVSDDLTLTAVVTVQPCAVVEIAAGKTITIGSAGALFLQPNTSGVGPSIWRRDATAWNRIRVMTGGTLSLNGSTVDGGGASSAAAITLEGGTLAINSAAITNSASIGLKATSGVISSGSYNLSISGSAAAPASVFANLVGSLPLGSYTGNADNEIEVSAISPWNVVSTSQTWHNQGVPYHVVGANGELEVVASTGVAVLTIDPGTTLRFDSNVKMLVDPAAAKFTAADGALVAAGTAAAPITFTSAASSPAAGDWLGVWFGGAIDSRTTVDHAVIAYAGGASTSGFQSCATPIGGHNDAAIRMMFIAEPMKSFVTNTTIEYSAKNGIDRGFEHNYQSSIAPVDFTATNTFISVPGCPQTHPADVSNACPAQPTCN